MVTSVWDNIGSGNGLLPDGTKPLPEPKFTYMCIWHFELFNNRQVDFVLFWYNVVFVILLQLFVLLRL